MPHLYSNVMCHLESLGNQSSFNINHLLYIIDIDIDGINAFWIYTYLHTGKDIMQWYCNVSITKTNMLPYYIILVVNKRLAASANTINIRTNKQTSLNFAIHNAFISVRYASVETSPFRKSFSTHIHPYRL